MPTTLSLLHVEDQRWRQGIRQTHQRAVVERSLGVAGVRRLGVADEEVLLRILVETGRDRLEVVRHAVEHLERRGGGDEAFDHIPYRICQSPDFGASLGCLLASWTSDAGCHVEVDDERGVIGGRLPLPCVAIDECPLRTLCQRLRGEHQIDAHAEVLVEVPGAVVPPRDTARPGRSAAGRRRPDPMLRALPSAARSGSLTWVAPCTAAGSQTSRSSGAMLKSPHTMTFAVAFAHASRCAPQPAEPSSLNWYCSSSSDRPFGTYTLPTLIPPHVADTMPRLVAHDLVVRREPDRGLGETDPAENGDAVPTSLAMVKSLVAESGERQRREGRSRLSFVSCMQRMSGLHLREPCFDAGQAGPSAS